MPRGASTLVAERPCAMGVRFTRYSLVIELEDGRDLHVPLEWSPRLRDATRKQLQHFRLMGGGSGIHWPDLDEDLAIVDLIYPAKIASELDSGTRHR